MSPLLPPDGVDVPFVIVFCLPSINAFRAFPCAALKAFVVDVLVNTFSTVVLFAPVAIPSNLLLYASVKLFFDVPHSYL